MSESKSDKSTRAAEDSVRSCYSTWGQSYYDEYYGPNAPYPPVHADLVKDIVRKSGARRILDAGCGPASMMRHLLAPGVDLYGFDLTREMVVEARRVMSEQGVSQGRLWEGSVLDPAAYLAPGEGRAEYDSVVCCGVLPHIPASHDESCINNIRLALRPGGMAVVEARNELFSLFTLNRYSYRLFLERLIPVEALRAQAQDEGEGLERALREVEGLFRIDQPRVRKGRASEPGYDEVLSRVHNPLLLREQFERAGFDDVRLYFYHFHSLPPLVGGLAPKVFRRTSLQMESNPEDWRGLFMASAFFVVARRA